MDPASCGDPWQEGSGQNSWEEIPRAHRFTTRMSDRRGNDSSGTRVKGASLIARLEYLTDTGGTELMDRVLERLSAADRKVLRGRPLPSSLFPLELNARLDEAIAQVLNPGKAAVRAVGCDERPPAGLCGKGAVG